MNTYDTYKLSTPEDESARDESRRTRIPCVVAGVIIATLKRDCEKSARNGLSFFRVSNQQYGELAVRNALDAIEAILWIKAH